MISDLRINRFAELAYESDDEKYELTLKKEAERKEAIFQLKMKKKEEKEWKRIEKKENKKKRPTFGMDRNSEKLKSTTL
jgi:hypothetical protein